MKSKTLIAVLTAALLFPAVPSAQSLKEIEQTERVEDALSALKKLDASMDEMIKGRETECLKVAGSRAFCSCLNENLAVAWSFTDYVAIVTRSKEANGYAKLDQDLKVAYDRVGPVRDQCVVQSLAP